MYLCECLSKIQISPNAHTLVGAEHDRVRRLVIELGEIALRILGKEFDVGAAASVFRLELDLVLKDERPVGTGFEGFIQFGSDGVVLGLVLHAMRKNTTCFQVPVRSGLRCHAAELQEHLA